MGKVRLPLNVKNYQPVGQRDLFPREKDESQNRLEGKRRRRRDKVKEKN